MKIKFQLRPMQLTYDKKRKRYFFEAHGLTPVELLPGETLVIKNNINISLSQLIEAIIFGTTLSVRLKKHA